MCWVVCCRVLIGLKVECSLFLGCLLYNCCMVVIEIIDVLFVEDDEYVCLVIM